MPHARPIPRLIAITPPAFAQSPAVRAAASSAIAAGLPALMLRDKSSIPDAELADLLGWLGPLARGSNCLFMVNRRLELARRLHADGIHLGVGGPSLAEARSALGGGALLGWSAHSVPEALAAFDQGADYVTLSPVFVSPHKGAPLGLEPLRELTRATRKPVIALGGIDPGNVPAALAAGAHGVAVIRAIFDRPAAAAVRELTAMLTS